MCAIDVRGVHVHVHVCVSVSVRRLRCGLRVLYTDYMSHVYRPSYNCTVQYQSTRILYLVEDEGARGITRSITSITFTRCTRDEPTRDAPARGSRAFREFHVHVCIVLYMFHVSYFTNISL